jgi:hypothetical protein
MLNRFLTRAGLLVVMAAVLCCFQACSTDENPVDTQNPALQPPALPAASTMAMNLSFFDAAQIDEASLISGVPGGPALSAAAGKEHFINAAVRVLFVNLVFCAAFEPPVAAFALAIHSIPQLQPDGSWLWTYIFVDGSVEYSIFLYGKRVADYNQWRMEVSASDPSLGFDHFVWFDGEAMVDGSSGYWQFYTPVEGVPAVAAAGAATPGVPSVRIDWLNTSANEHQLTILANEAGSEDEGDTVVFYNSPSASFVQFNDLSAALLYEIIWYPDGSGSIEVPDYNGGDKACWDTRQNNSECPQP